MGCKIHLVRECIARPFLPLPSSLFLRFVFLTRESDDGILHSEAQANSCFSGPPPTPEPPHLFCLWSVWASSKRLVVGNMKGRDRTYSKLVT